MLKALVFDFDGTLADTFQSVIDSVNDVKDRYRFDHIHDPEPLREKHWYDIIRNELRIPFLRIPSFYRRVKRKARARFLEAELFPEITDLLQALSRQFDVIILTSNHEKIVRRVLEEHSIEVDEIIGDVPIFRKASALTSMLKRRKLRTHELFYIGDEVRDIKACKKANVPVCAVTWGFHSKEFLRRAEPDYLIETPAELLQLVLALASSGRRRA